MRDTTTAGVLLALIAPACGAPTGPGGESSVSALVDSGAGADAGRTPASRARALSVSWGHACAIDARGRVLCWGENSGGVLGDGTTTARDRPTPVLGITDAVEVSTGQVAS